VYCCKNCQAEYGTLHVTRNSATWFKSKNDNLLEWSLDILEWSLDILGWSLDVQKQNISKLLLFVKGIPIESVDRVLLGF
jgi:endonuclease III-like uncharacterized protein